MVEHHRHEKPRRIPVSSAEERQPSEGAAETPAAESQEAETAAEQPADKAAELEERLAEVEDRWLRAAADLDNYRKRFGRELDRLRLAERGQILLAWLEVVDNMERALAAEGAASNPWFAGMEAIYQQMLGVLKRFGAEPFEAMGQMFDPRRHEAVATANLPDRPEGAIAEVVQTGYAWDGRVLRPAKVIPVKHR